MIKKKNLYIWVSDYSENSGEGRLARLYVKKLEKENKKIIFNQKKKLASKYFSSINGIIYCWQKYLNKQQVCYINYLPFWNFLLFVFLPPKTLFGPITGGARFSKRNIFNYFIRRFIFYSFYKVSELFISLRKIKIIFATDLLKKNLSVNTIKKSKFNFVFYKFKFKKKIRKKVDFLIYYRKHKNKNDFFSIQLIKKLLKKKYNVQIVGDKLSLLGLKNHGFISNSKILKLQAISKYTLVSGENLYSFFTLEAISNNMKILIDKKEKIKINNFKKSFIKIDYYNENNFKILRKCN